MQMRVEVGRRLGRHTFVGYRAMNPLLSLLGRPAAVYPGIEPYERFLWQLHDMWPYANIVLIPPFPRCYENRKQRPIAERVNADIRALAERRGVPLVDTAALLGRDRELRGATGYNLNGRGCEVIGRQLARIIVEQRRSGSRARSRRPSPAAPALRR
jgi:hypothetical protein